MFLISVGIRKTFTQMVLPKKDNIDRGNRGYGFFFKNGDDFFYAENVKKDWMEKIQPVLESFVDEKHLEALLKKKKNYSLAWH